MTGKPSPSFENTPPHWHLEGKMRKCLSKERRLCAKEIRAYLFTPPPQSQNELGDTDPVILLMPRSVVSLLDMRQVTGQADPLLHGSDRCSCCRVWSLGQKTWQGLNMPAGHSNVCVVPVWHRPSSPGKPITVPFSQIHGHWLEPCHLVRKHCDGELDVNMPLVMRAHCSLSHGK